MAERLSQKQLNANKSQYTVFSRVDHEKKAEGRPLPADGHQAILNKMDSHRQTESGRTMTIRTNQNRSTALERSVINKLVRAVHSVYREYYS